MAGLMSFVTSFFDKSQKENEDSCECKNAEIEKFSETDSDTNNRDCDSNSENSSDDQVDIRNIFFVFVYPRISFKLFVYFGL